MRLVVVDYDVALDGAVPDPESRRGARDDLFHSLLYFFGKPARQISTVLNKIRRIALEVLIIPVREPWGMAYPVNDDGLGRNLRSIEIFFNHDSLRRRMMASGCESLVEVLDVRNPLHTSTTPTVHRFDDEICSPF